MLKSIARFTIAGIGLVGAFAALSLGIATQTPFLIPVALFATLGAFTFAAS